MKSYDNLFITGCDKKTEWMLEWFLKNFRKHNPHTKATILVCDFGMSAKAYDEYCIMADGIIDMTSTKHTGWFKKPLAMLEASKHANKVCWLDTDCEVLSDITDVFSYVEPNKLAMVEDKPWSKRRGETWHNSGVVAFASVPPILKEWSKAVDQNPRVGDQEILHAMVREGMKRQIYISDLPQEYNWMRLMLIDGLDSKKKKIMHWTGQKGKDHIKKVMTNG